MNGIEVKDLVAKMGDLTLRAHFQLPSGMRLGLCAPSGAGKTSLLRALAGLSETQGGEVRVGSEDVTNLPAEKRNFGVVFQEGALFPHLTVLENVCFGLRMKGVGRDERENLGNRALAQVGLGERARDSVSVLSGGEAQRVALLRSWIGGPRRLLLLDEPFSALDPSLRTDLQGMLLNWLKDDPVPVLLITHQEEDLRRFCTHRLHFRECPDGVREFSMVTSI